MAYTVCNTRDSGLTVSGSMDSQGRSRVNYSVSQSYRVDYTGVTPENVTEVDVSLISELPTVNYTTWYNSNTGLSMPWCVCKSKEIHRDPARPLTFYVEATFETGDMEEEQTAASPPAALSDITPTVSATIGSYERVLFTDKDGKQCWKLPTGTPYQSPVTETIPTLTLTIEQFESSISFQQMLDRSFKLNSSTYRSKPQDRWLIGAVKAVEQTVQLAAGETTAVRVTYPIMLSERYFVPQGLSNTVANRTIYAHDAVQPLVDTMAYVGQGAAKTLEPIEQNGQVVSGYLSLTGYQVDIEGQSADYDRPDYLRHRRFDRINFNSFLLV